MELVKNVLRYGLPVCEFKEVNTIIIQCAWCKKFMGELAPFKDKGISHGMCPECLKKELKKGRDLRTLKGKS